MKKVCALIFCTLLNAACFVFGWYLSLNNYGNTFLFYIGPVVSVLLFLFLGNLFYKILRLNRTALWITMNIMGEYLGWVGLSFMTEEAPALLPNYFGFFHVIFLRLFVFLVVWGIIWAVSLILRRMQERGVNRAKVLLNSAGVLLCLLSAAAMCFSLLFDGISEGEGAILLFLSGIYLIGYIAFQVHNREQRRIGQEEYSGWRKAE